MSFNPCDLFVRLRLRLRLRLGQPLSCHKINFAKYENLNRSYNPFCGNLRREKSVEILTRMIGPKSLDKVKNL
jgi:hypothetical protein